MVIADNKNEKTLIKEDGKPQTLFMSKRTEFFSSSSFFCQGKGEHDIIVWLVERTQSILDKEKFKINITDEIQKKVQDSPFKLGYRGTLEILQDYINWIDIENYKS